jgi:hypothetical protein
VASTGTPRPGGGDQSELLAALLAASPRLGELLGPDPSSWVKKAGIDPGLREEGTRIFGEEGWVLPQTDFLPYLDASADLRLYDDLPPLGDSPRRTAWPEPSRPGYPPNSYGGRAA